MFTDKIKKIIHDRNLTPLFLAELMDVQEKDVIEWLNGDRIPSKPQILKLANLFELPIDEIMEQTVSPQLDDEVEKPELSMNEPVEQQEIAQSDSKLKNVMLHKNVNSKILSNILDLDEDELNRWIENIELPSEANIKKLSDFFELPPEDLFDIDINKEDNINKGSQIKKKKFKFSGVNKKRKKLILILGAIVLLIGIFSQFSSKSESGTLITTIYEKKPDGLYYNVTENENETVDIKFNDKHLLESYTSSLHTENLNTENKYNYKYTFDDRGKVIGLHSKSVTDIDGNITDREDDYDIQYNDKDQIISIHYNVNLNGSNLGETNRYFKYNDDGSLNAIKEIDDISTRIFTYEYYQIDGTDYVSEMLTVNDSVNFQVYKKSDWVIDDVLTNVTTNDRGYTRNTILTQFEGNSVMNLHRNGFGYANTRIITGSIGSETGPVSSNIGIVTYKDDLPHREIEYSKSDWTKVKNADKIMDELVTEDNQVTNYIVEGDHVYKLLAEGKEAASIITNSTKEIDSSEYEEYFDYIAYVDMEVKGDKIICNLKYDKIDSDMHKKLKDFDEDTEAIEQSEEIFNIVAENISDQQSRYYSLKYEDVSSWNKVENPEPEIEDNPNNTASTMYSDKLSQTEAYDNGGIVLEVYEQSDKAMVFKLEKIQMPPSNRVADIDEIIATKDDSGKYKFTFAEDGWGNAGEGTIEILSNGSIVIQVEITKREEGAMWDISLPATTLNKVS